MNDGPTRAESVRAVLVYTAARLLLLAGFVVIGWLVGLTGPLLLVLALLASGVVSLFLLQRQRIAMSATVESSVHRLRERAAARTAAEDAYVDRLQEQSEEGRHTEPAQ